MALVFFACWIVWALQEVGRARHRSRSCSRRRARAPARCGCCWWWCSSPPGCLEVVSILFRPVSLSFRLYGNIFAGENMLETMAAIVPGLGWLLPIPFYFMELLVGLVQALVFMLLTAVFTLLICQHRGSRPAAAHTDGDDRRRASADETRKDDTMTGSLHVGLAALGAAIGRRLDRHGASRRSDAIPARPRRSWCSRFWPSPSRKRSCSTRCSSCSSAR